MSKRLLPDFKRLLAGYEKKIKTLDEKMDFNAIAARFKLEEEFFALTQLYGPVSRQVQKWLEVNNPKIEKYKRMQKTWSKDYSKWNDERFLLKLKHQDLKRVIYSIEQGW